MNNKRKMKKKKHLGSFREQQTFEQHRNINPLSFGCECGEVLKMNTGVFFSKCHVKNFFCRHFNTVTIQRGKSPQTVRSSKTKNSIANKL
jgi:hypothetical protein